MMFNLKPLIPALLATSFLPATMAETCSAIGSLSDNSVVGLGPQGLSSNVILQNGNGDKIGELEVCDTCPHACTDLAYIEGEGLEDSFAWAASCSINHFKECHGAYATQTHIDGEEPEGGSDFYGVGIATSSQCKVEFEC